MWPEADSSVMLCMFSSNLSYQHLANIPHQTIRLYNFGMLCKTKTFKMVTRSYLLFYFGLTLWCRREAVRQFITLLFIQKGGPLHQVINLEWPLS